MLRRRRRPDPAELAYERLRAEAEPRVPLPPRLQRVDRKRLVVYAFLVLVVGAVVKDGLGRGAPRVDGSCTSPGFAFDRTEVLQDHAGKWAVAGPSGAQVVITADSDNPAVGRLLGPLTVQHCHGDGRFGVPLTDGDHVLHVFLLRPSAAPQQLGTARLTVNAPH